MAAQLGGKHRDEELDLMEALRARVGQSAPKAPKRTPAKKAA
jgi:hypothetical protein